MPGVKDDGEEEKDRSSPPRSSKSDVCDFLRTIKNLSILSKSFYEDKDCNSNTSKNKWKETSSSLSSEPLPTAFGVTRPLPPMGLLRPPGVFHISTNTISANGNSNENRRIGSDASSIPLPTSPMHATETSNDHADDDTVANCSIGVCLSVEGENESRAGELPTSSTPPEKTKSLQDVDDALWSIFCFYAVHGDPRNPDSMMLNEWLRLMRDTNVIRKGATNCRGRSSQDAYLVYAKCSKSKQGLGKAAHLRFQDFLEALIQMSFRVRVDRGDGGEIVAEDAFSSFLRKYILPRAKRLSHINVDEYKRDEGARDLKDHYTNAMLGIFEHYALHLGQHVAHTALKRRLLYLDSRDRRAVDHTICAERWSKFCNDFGLNRIMSTCQLVRIFLASAKTIDRNLGLHEMRFNQFWDALLRVTKVLYSNPDHAEGVPRVNQLRGLFLWMFRAIHGELREFVSYIHTQRKVEINRSNIERKLRPNVCEKFNKAFITDWQRANVNDFGLYSEDGIYHRRHAERDWYKRNEIRVKVSPKSRAALAGKQTTEGRPSGSTRMRPDFF
eukprot:g4170.t1